MFYFILFYKIIYKIRKVLVIIIIVKLAAKF